MKPCTQKKFKITNKLLSSFFQFLIVLTPFVAISPASVLFWGEPECPNEILNELKTK